MPQPHITVVLLLGLRVPLVVQLRSVILLLFLFVPFSRVPTKNPHLEAEGARLPVIRKRDWKTHSFLDFCWFCVVCRSVSSSFVRTLMILSSGCRYLPVLGKKQGQSRLICTCPAIASTVFFSFYCVCCYMLLHCRPGMTACGPSRFVRFVVRFVVPPTYVVPCLSPDWWIGLTS